MHHLQRHHLYPLDGERHIGLYGVEVQHGHTGIQHFAEEVGQPLAQVAVGEVIGKDVDVAESAEGAQVVDAARVVVVLVGEQHTVDGLEGHAEHLCTEVGTTVDEYARVIGFHKGRYAQPLVALVRGEAYGAGTPDFGYSFRGAGAEEGQFHE